MAVHWAPSQLSAECSPSCAHTKHADREGIWRKYISAGFRITPAGFRTLARDFKL